MKNISLLFVIILLHYTIINAQWVQTTGPSGVSNFASIGSNLFAGGGSIGVYISTDQGNTWANINSNLQDTSISCLAVSGPNLYAGTPSGIYRSTNNGTNWATASTGMPGYVTDIVVSTTNLFAGTLFGVFISKDNGTNWTAVNNGLTNSSVNDLAINGPNIFAATQSGVFLSTNNGANWLSAGLDNFGVGNLEVCYNSLFASTYGTNGTVYLSTDNGTTWSVSDSGLTDLNILNFEVYEANVFVATAFAGVFLTTNNGLNWTSVNAGLTTFYINALEVFETNLFAGSTSGSSVWRRPLSEMITDIEDKPNRIPTEFLLWQNWPNPFNPSTKITYSIPERSKVSLKIFDLLGSEVAELVNGEIEAGSYDITFNAFNLPSGIYFYQLKTENYIETKKMILIK